MLNDNDNECTGSYLNKCPQIVGASILNEVCWACASGQGDGTGATFYPEVQPDPEGNVLVVFNYSDDGTFPSSAYATNRATEALGTMHDSGFFLQSGLATYVLLDSNNINRWGDYTAASLDLTPGTQASFWFAGESSKSAAFYRTAIGHNASAARSSRSHATRRAARGQSWSRCDRLVRMEAITSICARELLLCVVVAVALAIAGCTRGDGRSASAAGRSNGTAASYGTLTGRITRGPTSPVSGPGITAPPSARAAGAELKIFDSKGAMVATARADAGGLYRLALPPGDYRVERGGGFSGAARNLPAMVTISPGGETRLDIWVDTGIRAPGAPAAIR